MGFGSGSSMAAAWQRPMALLAGRMQLSACGSAVQAQGSQQHLHLQHQHQSQGFAVSSRRPGPAAGSLGLLLQRKPGPLLAVGDDELEITCVQELADGSIFFSFGGSAPPQLGKRMEDLASCRAELVATPAPLHLPQRPPSHFMKHSPIPVLAARRKTVGRKPETEVDAGAAPDEVGVQVAAPSVRVGRSRPASTFVKRSPIPKGTAQRRKGPSEPSEGTSVSGDVVHIGLDAVAPAVETEIPTRGAGEIAILVQRIAEEEEQVQEQEHVTAEVPAEGAVESARVVVQVNAKERGHVTADIPRTEPVEAAPVGEVKRKEQDQEALVCGTVSVNSGPKSSDRARRRTSRKAARSDQEASSQTRHSTPPHSAEAPQALVAPTPAPVPSRPPSKFVRRSPIPAVSQKRSVTRSHPVVAPAESKEILVVRETVVKETSVTETVQARRTSAGRSPSTPAAVVVAASVTPEQTHSRPNSSFVRRSPISRRDAGKVVEAHVGVAEPQVDVDAVKVVEAASVVSEPKVEEKAAAVLPKPGAPARSRTKPASSKLVSQPVTSPAVEAPTPIATGSDSESEDDQSPESSASTAAPGDLATSTLPQLKSIAKARGLKGYSKLKKSELIELIQSSGTSL